MLLFQFISRTTGAGCSVDHGTGMNYPTTTASGTWTTRGGISSYGWDSRQPIDPCSRCTNVPPPLPGSQYTTHIHDVGYGANDRISVSDHVITDNRVAVSGYGSDNRIAGYGSDNRGNEYSFDKRGHNNYHTNSRPNDFNLNSNGNVGNGFISNGNYGGKTHVTDNRVNSYSGYKIDNQIKNPNYRGNGYDNLSPEWERRHSNRKGSVGGGSMGGSILNIGGGYYQGMSYPVSNVPDIQEAHMHGTYQRPSSDRWNIKGSYPMKIESGYWQSQPPKDIGWDEDSKRVGVIAGWIGGPKKYESGKPLQSYDSSHQINNKNDDYFNKGTGFDSSDQKKPYMGWGGSGSYEVVKMNNGYKYIDRNGNGDYGTTYGNSYGYGGQSNSYDNKLNEDYASKPLNDKNRPHGHGISNYKEPSGNGGYNNLPTQEYGSSPPIQDYGSRPSTGWSTSRPIGFEVTSSKPPPPAWGSQKPGYPVIASRPTQHWGENSLFNEQSGDGGSTGYNRPSGNHNSRRPDSYGSSKLHNYGYSRPNEYGSSKLDGYGLSRPDSYGSFRPDGYNSFRPDGYSSSRPDGYGSSAPNSEGGKPDYGSSRPFVGSMHHSTIMVSDYGSQRPDFDKFSGFSENDGDGGRPQMNNRPSYDNEKPFMNGNDIYGSQQQPSSGYGKGYASNWNYQSNSMR